MVSFTALKSASLLALFSTLASAAPTKDACSGFHVTSPHTYFTTTAGQCYQVSYDFASGIVPKNPSTLSVDLYEAKTNKFINNLVKNSPITNGISTPWFNLDLGSYKKTSEYYFIVTYGAAGCKPITTTSFQITYNKNSPPSVCP